jgi:DNA-binding IclR family transcriptional regulator
VGRAIDVLLWLADHPGPWGIRMIAREVGTSPATVHRIFRVFEGRGLLRKDADGVYSAGLERYRMAQEFAARLSPVRIARPHLEALVEKCGETALLGAYDVERCEMIFLDMVPAPHPLRYAINLNVWIPVHAGASGLAILAYLSDAERKAVYGHGLSAETTATLVVPDEVEAAVSLVRERGYALSRGERLVGAVGIAVPVFDCVGNVYGDISLTIPEQRYEDALERTLVSTLLQVGAQVTDDLRKAGCRR